MKDNNFLEKGSTMKRRLVVNATFLYLVLALSIAPAAHAAPVKKEGTAPPLPQNAVVLATSCDPKTGVCSTLFQSVTSGTSADDGLAASPTTNLYICGVDIIRQGDGAWLGRLQQNVYGSWGWGPYSNGWKLDSGNLSTSAALGYWWASLNGPNPDDPWGTITVAEHVKSSAWLMPIFRMAWVDAYFQALGNYSCTGG
jgi:hypothetical protein